MEKLVERQHLPPYSKFTVAYQQLNKLLMELELRSLSADTIEFINHEIVQLNAIDDGDKHLVKRIKEKENNIIRLVEKKHKIVPRNHYRKMWMLLGMSAFGVPMGVAFGLSMANLGLLGVGLPMGMAVGVAVGSVMDKKAAQEGRQLNMELK